MIATTRIGEFIKNHVDWETILQEEPYHLKIQRDENFVLFKYNQIKSDFVSGIVRESRGIIFRYGKWNVPVCHAFDKFGNIGEKYVPDLDWSTTKVSEKIDGSLIKVWYDTVTGWRVSTNGTINAYKATYSDVENANFGKLFEEGLLRYNLTIHDLFRNLEPGFTYMFELVSPKTRVVIPYKETDIYFLGYRDNYTNTEFPFYVNRNVYNFEVLEKLNKPKVYSLSTLDDAIHAAENLPWDEEGYVACDTNGNRVKIKSPQYVLAHYVRNNNNVTNETLVGVAVSGESEEFLTYAEDYTEALHRVTDAIKKFKNDCVEALKEMKTKTFDSRKEYALEVQRYPENIRPYLFINIGKDVSIDDFTCSWSSSKWLKYIEV